MPSVVSSRERNSCTATEETLTYAYRQTAHPRLDAPTLRANRGEIRPDRAYFGSFLP